MATLRGYSSPKALGHRLVEEILDGDVIIQEKIDGSQISFGLINGELFIRSRKADINPEDPGMFGKAVEEIELVFSILAEGWIYRGEYLAKPKHNTIKYGRTPSKNIVLFDIEISPGSFLPQSRVEKEAQMLRFDYAPLFFSGPGEEITTKILDQFVKFKRPVLGGEFIEGCVIKNYDKWLNDKVMMAKYVSADFQERHQTDWKKRNPGGLQKIHESINKEAIWNKAIQHLDEEGVLVGEPKDIGPLMKEINIDFTKENKEEIRDLLMNIYWKDILRYVGRGFPEYYKQLLVDRMFNKEEGDAEI